MNDPDFGEMGHGIDAWHGERRGYFISFVSWAIERADVAS